MSRLVLFALLGACTPKPIEPEPLPVPVEPVAPLTTEPTSGAAVDVAPATPPEPEPAEPERTDGFTATTADRFNDAVAMLTTNDANKARAALEILEPLAAENPDAAVIQYNIGVARHVAGEDTEARRAWSRATELDPKLAKAWLNLGLLSANEGRADMALASFQSGSRHAPDNVDLRVATIAVLRDLRRYEEAIREARTALGINSMAVPIYNNLALVYLDTNQLDLARFILQKAMTGIDGASANAQLHATLGEVFYRQKLPGDALASFRKALELDRNQLTALGFLANYYLDNRNYSDALPLLERAAQLRPKDAGIRINLGIAYRGVGRYEDAIKSYQDALRLDPRNPEPHRNLAVLYGDYMKAFDAAINAIHDYRRAGGGPAADLDAWIDALRKEQTKIEDKKRKEEAARLKREEEERAAAALPPPQPETPQPEAPQPEAPQPEAPQPEAPQPVTPQPETPKDDGSQDPWGGG